MKNKILSTILTFILVILQCFVPVTIRANNIPSTYYNNEYYNMNDSGFVEYIENSVFEGLAKRLDQSKYAITDVKAIYISKEYLDELEYNSRKNIYFGYKIEELDRQFEGARYVFCNDIYGKTVVRKFEAYDDTYEQVAKNVAIGTGVIAVCCTVAVIGGPAVSVIFFTAAKAGMTGAVVGAAMDGIPSFISTYCETRDFELAAKQGALSASNGFKWGAISGAVLGGASKAYEISKALPGGLTMDEAVKIHKQSQVAYNDLKRVKSMEDFKNTFRKGGSYKDITKWGSNNKQFEYNHMPADSISKLPKADGPAIRMTKADHMKTASWGSSADAKAYREAQRKLVEQGKYREAINMDIEDIRSKFGSKYDKEIMEMMEYVADLERQGVI